MTNKDHISNLLKSLKHIQAIRHSNYKRFEYIYKGIISKFFKPSAVSITFRVSIKDFNNQNELKKEEIKNLLSKTILEKNQKGINVEDLKKFIIETDSHDLETNIDIIFMKRPSANKRDLYAGNISFPGGKYETEDKNLLNTAIRETKEEIGLSLIDSNYPLPSRVVCQNFSVQTPLGFKFLVTSYIFILFDLENAITQNLDINKDEVSDVILTPIEYLYNIKSKDSRYIRKVCLKNKALGEYCVEKVVLNDNENFMLFGMTLRLINKILNYNMNIMYHASDIEVTTLKQMLFVFSMKLYDLISVPYYAYCSFKYLIIGLLMYSCYLCMNYLNGSYLFSDYYGNGKNNDSFSINSNSNSISINDCNDSGIPKF